MKAPRTLILQFFLWYAALILTFAGSVIPLHVCSSTWCRCASGKHPHPRKLLCFAHTKKMYELHSWIWPILIELKPKSRQIFYNWRTWHKIITRINFPTWFRMPSTRASRTMGMGASEHDQWRASQSAAPGPIAWLYSLKDFHASVVQTSSIFIHLFCKRWPWSAHMTLKCPWTS